MNYLGHIFLSGDNEQIMIGNFIGDYVKGKQFNNYPPEIRTGILLHRTIDHFTDQNEHWIEIRTLLKPLYKRYAGVVADVLIDHFLAKNWSRFSNMQLDWFSKWAYAVFLRNFDQMPLRVQSFLPYLIQHRRLQSYAHLKGFETAVRIMSFHTSLPENTDKLMKFIKHNYSALEVHSLTFLQEVVLFVKTLEDGNPNGII